VAELPESWPWDQAAYTLGSLIEPRSTVVWKVFICAPADPTAETHKQSRFAGKCRWAAPPARDDVTGPLIEEVLAMSDSIGLVAARNLQCHERAFQQRREEHGSHP
jgi:hypothetical protein